MKTKNLLIAIFALIISANIYSQTVDEIIATMNEKSGKKENLSKINSYKVTGTIIMPLFQMEGTLISYFVKPNKFREEVEFTGTDVKSIQAYDGEKGWVLEPPKEKKPSKPRKMTSDEAKEQLENSLFKDAFDDYKEKGTSIELLGKDTIDGVLCFKMKVKEKGENPKTYWIDCIEYNTIQIIANVDLFGRRMDTKTTFKNYIPEAGIVVPHSLEVKLLETNAVFQIVIFETIEINPQIDDELFKMPK